MQCAEPYVMHGSAFPCGKCLPCLTNRKRIWTHRMMLEATLHKDNTFATLTYSDEHLPMMTTSTGERPTLLPEDHRNFLKRLRKAHPQKLRFFGVGEYGSQSERPHYHYALFNFPNCTRGQTGLGMVRPSADKCCTVCALVQSTWGKGNIYLGTLETSSAQYVAGYVTKKLTRRDHPVNKGREPEFARMSNRPGLGADFMWDAASAHLQFNLEDTEADVPVSLRHGNRQMPLGRYLRKKYRTYIGKDEKTPQVILDQLAEKVRPLREAAYNASKPFAQQLKEAQAQSLVNFETKLKIKGKKRETF